MIRLILVVLLLVALFFLVRGMIRDMKARNGPRTVAGTHDQVVQDPVCLVYVPRESAVATKVGEQTYYFCSKECAQAFERGAAG